MKIVCAWCRKDLDEKPPLTNPAVSHGMCSACEVWFNQKLDAAEESLKKSPQASARNTWFVPTLITLLFLLGGCNGVDRLLEGSTASPSPPQTLLGGPAPLGDAPVFNVPTPEGFDRIILYGYMPASGVIPVTPGARIRVFLKNLSINQWFALGHTYSGAFWYTQEGSVVHYQGVNLGDKLYCIYQYIPKEEL